MCSVSGPTFNSIRFTDEGQPASALPISSERRPGLTCMKESAQLHGPGRSFVTTTISDTASPRIDAFDPSGSGVRVPRRWTQAGLHPLDEVRWDKRKTVISNPDGSVVFRMDGVEVPAEWSQ